MILPNYLSDFSATVIILVQYNCIKSCGEFLMKLVTNVMCRVNKKRPENEQISDINTEFQLTSVCVQIDDLIENKTPNPTEDFIIRINKDRIPNMEVDIVNAEKKIGFVDDVVHFINEKEHYEVS
ncbi:jg21432 [Pararge aegeria aegeria]|uniref:Jg21432 protein n=1 Tax=Pararge aegeria aegeria TaxID=348720 RepID=A0A8S4RAV2_9NEOP|nr:jg21432 [Pararge aegeria aegeria]